MKLYLASDTVPTPQDLFDLVGKPAADIKVAYIPNSKDYYATLARKVKIDRSLAKLVDIGLHPVIVDLRDFHDPDSVKKALQQYDMIWVVGGNTFVLRHAMKASGFDQVIKQLLEDGLVWGGDSAGALIAGPTLKSAELCDDPEFAPEVIWQGLGLTDKFIMPHADSPDFADAVLQIRRLHKNDANYIELNDTDAYVIDGNSSRKVSNQG